MKRSYNPRSVERDKDYSSKTIKNKLKDFGLSTILDDIRVTVDKLKRTDTKNKICIRMCDLVFNKFVKDINSFIGKNYNSINNNISNSILSSIKSALKELQTNENGEVSLSKVSNKKLYAINIIIKACVKKSGIKTNK